MCIRDSSLSYLVTTRPKETTVGGQPAWELEARIGKHLPANPAVFGKVPGVHLVRIRKPVSDVDTLTAWFDKTYTKPSRLWLIDLPNGTVGYVEAGPSGPAGEAQVDHVLQTMRFETPSSP